ncbi:prefoldin subunit alpha [Acidianus sp. HS-5]|uniref:prefoldin subunit alpha n=1 Tax=Acidianus sp. HS-5 TaxID=2886040 RepID=UPI001EFF88EC|nr:prefoldin subunit alpha [Acidianus sp. HS-5]BDC19802.1 prefoldin subunit alpha [Acidianus sp. HS-5]
MSDQEENKVVVSLDDLLAQAQLLKKQIDDLSAARAELSDSVASIEAAKASIQELKTQQEMLVSTDKKGYLMFKIDPQPPQKVLVYLGLSYYAEVDMDTALKILDDRENELKEAFTGLDKKLAESKDAYDQIVDILNQIQAQAQQKGE